MIEVAEVIRTRNSEAMSAWLALPHSPEQLNEALREATTAGWVEAIQPIVSAGGDLCTPDPGNAWSFLHIATELQQLDVIRELARLGADINARDSVGWTPLHLAVDLTADSAWQTGSEPNMETIELLLELGADRECTDANGETAADLAKKWDQRKLIDALM